MYHDEFRKAPARRPSRIEDALAGLAFEMGGGLSLGLAASLDRNASSALFLAGGLLPMLACSLGILAHRASSALDRLARALGSTAPDPAPATAPGIAGPHSRAALRGSRLSATRPRAARAGFDDSRRLG